MKATAILRVLLCAATLGTTGYAYEWHYVPVDPNMDQAAYEIQFDPAAVLGGGHYFAGLEAGVYRGDGEMGNWKGVGLPNPGLAAYSILSLPGAGWMKQVINEEPLFHATGVGVRDFDGDGCADVVVAAKPPGNAVLRYVNPGLHPMPFWSADTVEAPAMGAREVSFGDIDNDDDLDIAVALRDEDQIAWYEKRQDPGSPQAIQWVRHDVGDPLDGPRGVFVADINRDDRLDLVAGGMNANTVVWIEQPIPGVQPWVTHYVDTDLAGVKGVFACDIDGDDDLDIIAAGRDAGDLVWYEQVVTIPETWIKHFIDTGLLSPVSVWCGDLNDDGRPDVALTVRDAGQVIVYEAPPDPGDVWTPVYLDSDLTGACAIAGGDFDGDGRIDIVATGKLAQVVAWYRNPWNPGADWEKSIIDPAAGSSMGVTTGDLDGDGDLDVVSTCLEGEVSCHLNDLGDQYCAFSDGTGGSLADGVYHWHDLRREWTSVWHCPRPFFIEPHPLVPDLYFCGNHQGLFSSDDFQHWQEVGAAVLPDTVRCIWFHPLNPGIMMVGTNRGMYRLEAAAVDWYPMEDVPPIPVNDIAAGSPFQEPPDEWVFAAVGDGSFSDGLYRSRDGGVTWERSFAWPEPTCLVPELSLLGPTHIMFVGTAMDGIQRVAYSGLHLGDLNNGLGSLAISRMRYDPFIIGGYHLYTCTAEELWVCHLFYEPGGAPPSVQRGAVCRAQPNPWREALSFTLPESAAGGHARVRVVDVSGREVWASDQPSCQAGARALRWNGETGQGERAVPGVYFYSLETQAGVHHGKVLRVR